MTDNEKVELRALKEEMAERLSSLVRKSNKKLKKVWSTDARIKKYIKDVAKHPNDHNVWEICAIVSFYDKLERYDWHPVRARLNIDMAERFRFQNDDGFRRILLQPVQVFMAAVPYGLVKKVKETFVDENTHTEYTEWVWRRVTRKVVWMVPRKFGKTTMIASFGGTEFFFGPSDAEVDIVSTTGRQAKICYNMIKLAMMDLVRNDIDLQNVVLRYNRESVFYDNPLDGAQRINVYGDNPDALNGLKPSLAIEDESASFSDTPSKSGNESRNTLESGQGPRAEPLSFQITTASKYVDGPFARSLNGIKRVLAGQNDDDSLFAMLFCPDVDDREDDPHTWAKVHPMLGKTVQADYYQNEWNKCQNDATYISEFRTKLLNIFDVPFTSAWIPGKTVMKLMVEWDPLKLPIGSGIQAMIGIDLAQKWDFTAVSVAIYREDIRQIWVHTKCFLPDGIRVWTVPRTQENEETYLNGQSGLDSENPWQVFRYDESYIYLEEQPFDGKIHSGHPNAGIYHKWIDDGEMILTHGTIVDYDVVARYILEVAEHVEVQKIGYDDYKWQEFANYLARYGSSDNLVAFGQTYGDFTAPTIFFELGVEKGTILLAKSDLVRWCFDNAVLDTDSRGNVKPMKLGDYLRIDPVITSIMACGLWSDLGHTRHNRNNFEK